MIKVAGKKVMVVGLGASGRAAAAFLASRRAQLTLTDIRDDLDPAELAKQFPGAAIKIGPEDSRLLDGIELVVASPGVPPDAPLLAGAKARGIPLIGEIELASQFLSAPIAAITGTNGKSTVTTMLGQILRAAGMHTFVGGNLGEPLTLAIGGVFDALVVEVSSFQLETIDRFKPRVGIYLNLSDDHFERYAGLTEYGAAKERLFKNQDGSDWAILNRDDANVWKLAKSVRSRVFGFGFVESGEAAAIWPDVGTLKFHLAGRRGEISLKGFALPGRHNISNAMAAAAAALAMFVDEKIIAAALRAFSGLPHRIEFVREVDGVKWIDDSKATNVDAAVRALESMAEPIILIAGGVDKGGDYAPLIAPLHRKAKLAILIGAAREVMRAALTGACEIEMFPTLEEAVERAAKLARRGDTVMLSPACSSFDQFKDYAERGDIFQKLVRAL